MPGNDVLCDPRVLRNLNAAASLGLDAIGLGVVRSGRLQKRRVGDALVRIVPVPSLSAETSLESWLQRVRAGIRLGYETEEQEEQARARLSYFIRETRAAAAHRHRDHDRESIVHSSGSVRGAFAGRLRVLVLKGIVKFRAHLGRRSRAAEAARAERAPDRQTSLAAARKSVRWRKELPSAIDDDIVLGRELDRLRPDIIHVHDVFMLGVAARAAARAALKGRKVRLVYDVHEYLPGLTSLPVRLIAAYCDLEREFLPHYDRIITVSESLADLLVKDYGLKRRPDLVLNAPVVDRETPDVPQIRDVVGLADDVPLLVYGGGVVSARGVHTVVEALVELPGVHLVIVVRAPNAVTKQLASLAEELGVADRVHEAGFVPPEHVTRYFASADIGVSPLLHCINHDVALTNKFCEYLLAGIPVITSDTPEQARLVTELGVGEVYPAGDVAAFAQAVRQTLARRQELRERIADPEIQYRFSWTAQEHVLSAVYGDLLGIELSAPPAESGASSVELTSA